jgi:hypothetical protein
MKADDLLFVCVDARVPRYSGGSKGEYDVVLYQLSPPLKYRRSHIPVTFGDGQLMKSLIYHALRGTLWLEAPRPISWRVYGLAVPVRLDGMFVASRQR